MLKNIAHSLLTVSPWFSNVIANGNSNPVCNMSVKPHFIPFFLVIWKQVVLVTLGNYNRNTTDRMACNMYLFLTVPEAGSPQSRQWQIQCL